MSEGDLNHVEQLAAKYPDVPRFVLLKLALRYRGVRLLDPALQAISAPEYNYGPVQVFRYHDEEALKKAHPGPLLFRDGTTGLVAFEEREVFEDPYGVDYEGGKFLLYDDASKARLVDEIDFTPRPAYYGKRTSSGKPMESIATARAQRMILCAYRHCHFWDTGEQCKYCAFFTDLNETRQVSEKKFPKGVEAQDIYETVREILKEPGRVSEIYMTAGADYEGQPPFEQEVDRYVEILQAIGRNFKGRFSSQLMAPAYSKAQYKRLHERTGLTTVCPNIEVWDERLFKWICPGKERFVGREKWIRNTVEAVEVFGRGNVYTQVIGGVELAKPHGFKTEDEALESNFEACEFYSRNGVIFVSVVFGPARSSVFHDQKRPSLEYYVRLVRGLREIRRKHGLTADNDDYKHCGNHADADLERVD